MGAVSQREDESVLSLFSNGNNSSNQDVDKKYNFHQLSMLFWSWPLLLLLTKSSRLDINKEGCMES